MSILTCKELNVSYDQTQALKDVSFELNEGDYLCIVGDNGSGKSTLMKSILDWFLLSQEVLSLVLR